MLANGAKRGFVKIKYTRFWPFGQTRHRSTPLYGNMSPMSENSDTSAPPAKSAFNSNRWRRASAEVRPRYTFSSCDPREAKRWQRALRRQFINRLGGFPDAVPLRPRVLSREDCGDYWRETLRFTSREGLSVFAYFLVPHDASQPLPTILCLHGHGPGADPIVGLNSDGKPLQEAEYQNAFAVQAVRQGYAVLAPEILGFGRRRETSEPGFHGHSCQTLSGTALMLGQTMAGWRTYDAMRALDYLETRPEVDTKRMGAMGISGGGLNTLYLAAVDTRVRAAMVSGFLNTFRDSIMSIDHCIDNFVPGLLLDAEMSDIAGLVAPRALWCENGTRDPIFPVAAFRRALRDVKKIYSVFAAPDNCDGEVFDGEHQFYGASAWDFLEKHLKHG